MERCSRLKESDIRAMLRLMGELGDLPNDPRCRAVFLMDALCKLIDAQWGIFAHLSGFCRDGQLVMRGAVQGGTLDAGLAGRFLRYVQEECAIDPMAHAAAALQPMPLVRSRQQLVRDTDWYNSAHYCDFRRPAHLDESLYAFYPLDREGHAIGFGLTRPGGAPPFSERERKIVEFLNDGLAWFYHKYAESYPMRSELPPALRRTLEFLLQGASEKQIAHRTQLSRHTVHDHVKALYRRFDVGSRAELLAKLLRAGCDPRS